MGQAREKDRNNLIKGYNMMLYFAGSMIVYEPTQECVTHFWSEGMVKTLPVSSSNPRFIAAASQLRESCSDISKCREMLALDFKRLFSDQANLLAPPVSSFYSAGEVYTEEPADSDVTSFYRDHGWKPSRRLPDDHLGTELMFLSLLLDRFTANEDADREADMAAEIRRYIAEHLLSWIPAWQEKMQENALTLCYKGIATLIYASVEDLYAILSNAGTGY
ncbi:MAG: molecular chaperone TorD family protein [Bacteroidales bacterium]|jgi:TorA maturation chaperone TorD|nr:molecular chaperone TorD family protein [Bacteroidales bacterium]